jgi:hypothetical protein
MSTGGFDWAAAKTAMLAGFGSPSTVQLAALLVLPVLTNTGCGGVEEVQVPHGLQRV